MFRRVVGRPVGLIVAASAIAAAITGLALADAGSPPSGGYVPVTPAFTILNGVAVGAGKIVSATALGGSTTVPMDATAVELALTIKDTKAGTLQIFPSGDPTAGGATAVSFIAGTTTATVHETIGSKSQVSFHNTSAATATVTAAINGYSTQLTAQNIAGDGGSAGQVLTNTGTGVAWQQPAGIIGVSEDSFDGSLPASFTFTKKLDASDLLITFSGTAFSTTANTDHALFADVRVGVDTFGVGTSLLYFNNAFEHLAFPTEQVDLFGAAGETPAGTYTFTLSTDAATDSNDHGHVTILEVTNENGLL